MGIRPEADLSDDTGLVELPGPSGLGPTQCRRILRMDFQLRPDFPGYGAWSFLERGIQEAPGWRRGKAERVFSVSVFDGVEMEL